MSGEPSEDPVSLNGAILRVNPAPARPCPTTRSSRTPAPMRSASSAMARETPSGSRSVQARTRSGSVTSAMRRGRRSTGSPTRRRPRSRTSGGPAMRASDTRPRIENQGTQMCTDLYAAGASAVTAPYYTYNHGGQHRQRRDLLDRQLSHRRARVLLDGELRDRLSERPLLHRPFPKLHLVHESRHEWPAGQEPDLRLRQRRRPSSPAGDRSGRRPLLRLPRGWRHPSDHAHGGQWIAAGRHLRDASQRSCPPPGRLQRHRIVGPRWRCDLVCVGPRW